MVCDSLPSQDTFTHQILNSYLKEYRRYRPGSMHFLETRSEVKFKATVTQLLCHPKFEIPTSNNTVSHFSYAPFFQGPHFLTKMLESNILYDSLFIDILSVWWHRKKILESLMQIILLRQRQFWQKMQKCKLNVHIFCFLFCASHYPWWSLWQKNTKNNYFIQVKPPFWVVEFSNTITFWRNACFDVILTPVTIIKQGFLRKLFCYESLVDIEVSKH